MIHKIVDGFDIDPFKCFGVKWKHSVNEMPCLLKYQNSDDMIEKYLVPKVVQDKIYILFIVRMHSQVLTLLAG